MFCSDFDVFKWGGKKKKKKKNDADVLVTTRPTYILVYYHNNNFPPTLCGARLLERITNLTCLISNKLFCDICNPRMEIYLGSDFSLSDRRYFPTYF